MFAHSTDIRNENILLTVGGYHGKVNADLWAYVLPPTIVNHENKLNEPNYICGQHRSLKECTSNPECGWCSADDFCYGRTIGNNCTTNLQTTSCPGLCAALRDCYSCLLQGEVLVRLDPSYSTFDNVKFGYCVWCVQNAKCRHKDGKIFNGIFIIIFR